LTEQLHRIAFCFPLLLFAFWPVIGAVDITDVVAVEAIGFAIEKTWTGAAASTRDGIYRCAVDSLDILTVKRFAVDAESFGARGQPPRGGFAVVGILVVLIVLANVDHRQFPERRHVHALIHEALS